MGNKGAGVFVRMAPDVTRAEVRAANTNFPRQAVGHWLALRIDNQQLERPSPGKS